LESEGLQNQIAQQKIALAEKINEDAESNTYSVKRNPTQINGEKMDYDTEDSKLFKNNFMSESGYFNPINTPPPAPPLPPQLMAK